MILIIPEALADSCRKSLEGAVWLERLPEVIAEFRRRWSLTPGAPFRNPGGSFSWGVPVKCADGSKAVLKDGLPHMEAEHEMAFASGMAGGVFAFSRQMNRTT